jgi:glycosyltransferase involved in cell wall biosynthesis
MAKRRQRARLAAAIDYTEPPGTDIDLHLLSSEDPVALVARDEDYTIPFAIRSLAGFADQVVVVDNGSVDSTLAKVEALRAELGARLQIDVLTLPDALLSECHDEALRRSTRSWHLRWDADMILNTEGPASMLLFREQLLRDPRPRAVVLPYLNVYGDLRHTLNPAICPTVFSGEPYLMTITRNMRYREYGKFDFVRTPWFYIRESRSEPAFLHLGNLKSTQNRLRRFHYFTWRKWSAGGASFRRLFPTLESFAAVRNQHLFGTNDPLSLRFRFDRDQVDGYCVPLRIEEYASIPAVLREEYASATPRFEVEYRAGVPYRRVDREDQELLAYRPTKDDTSWEPRTFRARVRDEGPQLYMKLARAQ